ncbi:UDP-N-acetylmuramate--L-alanine ligase [Candidatus Cyanaurora vandensis]|uniref:UDP-N-acetylmuramate--L-alanine ligase n=1 Tax=Candidatus Cyanaurora vandensis TaxID=2714958 RepID=UPI002579D9D8|nr:UDP-N-acetylmuramate--L-alanine ligase [Candidatus Cyanaurora vandensis]
MVARLERVATTRALRESWHFIGIGGIGMSALAYLLAKQGARVSGSDLKSNAQTERLSKLGVAIHYGHCAENLCLDDDHSLYVVYSTAIDPSNPEYRRAQELQVPLLHRAQVLAHIARSRRTIGVSGTHGKTTTSSMLACLLTDSGLDPTVLVGGEVLALGGNARWGQGEHLVAEVDESDGSLVLFHPQVAVITNIEADHLDHYRDLTAIVQAFTQFIQQSEEVVLCLDCPNTRQLTGLATQWTGYSLHHHPQARYTVGEVHYGWHGTDAEVLDWGESLGRLHLPLTAPHNLSNALAVVAVGRQLGLTFAQIGQSLGRFQGAQRRFQKYGECGGVLYVDDYAHHPSEIRATLASAKLSGRPVVAIFQPHRYSRTTALLEEFSTCFAQADRVVLTEIYSAGERKLGVTGAQLAQAVAKHHPQVHYCPDLAAVRAYLPTALQPGDLALFLGAGDLNSVIPQLCP